MENYFKAKYLFEYIIPLGCLGCFLILLLIGLILTKIEDKKKYKWLRNHGFKKVVRDINFGTMLDAYDWVKGKITISDNLVLNLDYKDMVARLEKEMHNVD